MPELAPGASADAAAPTDAATAPAAEGQDKTFTQADLDRIVSERLAREARRFGDYEDVKAKAARLDELEAANASELDKAVAAARKEVETELTTRFTTERVADKIAVAAAGKFADPADAPLYLGAKAAEFVSPDGTVNTDAIAAAVDALLEAKPHLKATTEAPKPPAPSSVGLGVTGNAASADNVSPGLGRMASAYASQ